MLCPADMNAESSSLEVPTQTSQKPLIANATSPPLWQTSWLEYIPFIGRLLHAGMSFSRYATTLEQNADLIASDLESRESRFIGMTVGVIDGSK